MADLSDISIVNIFKGVILDSLINDRHMGQPSPQSPWNFLRKNKSLLLSIAAVTTGFALGPFAIGGIVTALGFGEAGIAAGSIAAWMMSLHRGAVAAGSLVSILQSVGAAGLGIGGVIASGFGGSIFAGAIAKAILGRIESNPEELAELENFVSITSENDEDDTPTKVIFGMKRRLLVSNENEVLGSFFRGFNLAQKITETRIRRFEFRCEEDCEGLNFLGNLLRNTYGISHVITRQRSLILNLD